MTAPSPTRALADAFMRDGARPLLTFYDDATGERVELSVATFENWVAKTANLVLDGVGLGPGARVALLLPLHWQTAVWWAACWRVGATAVLVGTDPAAAGREAPSADLVVTGPTTLDAALGGDEVVALSLRPLGARFVEALPAGVVDYAAEVAGHGDRFAPIVGAPEVSELDDAVLTGSALATAGAEQAARWGLEAGGRLHTALAPDTLAGALALLPAALAVGGSVVLVANEDLALREERARSERVTAFATD